MNNDAHFPEYVTVRVRDLRISPKNTRKRPSKTIRERAASIRHHGLLKPLIIEEVPAKGKNPATTKSSTADVGFAPSNFSSTRISSMPTIALSARSTRAVRRHRSVSPPTCMRRCIRLTNSRPSAT